MSLRDDDRGQAIQIGAVLLFAILIIVFAIYQAFIIPGQNREVEFNHNQRVEGDMVELRNTMLETKSTGDDGYVTIELGTAFPPRLIALNPPPPSGSLRSTDRRPIVIEDGGTDITDEVCPGTDHRTRFVEYAPSYSVYGEAGTIRFENTLVYHEFRDGTVKLTGQTLVRNDTVQIIPLTGNLSYAGSQTVAVEPIAGLLDTSEKTGITVTVPTALSETQWEDALQGQVDPSNVDVTTGAGGQNLTLTLSGERRIECGPLGLGSVPPSGARGGEANEINPAAPGEIRLVDETRSGSQMTLTFNNTAGTNNFTEGRINFYEAQGGNSPTEADVFAAGEPVSATLQIRGDYKVLSPKIELQGDGTETDVIVDFDQNINQNDWFVITFILESGETALYFVPGG